MAGFCEVVQTLRMDREKRGTNDSLLPYEQRIVSELLEDDGLAIIAPGLGFQRILAALVRCFSASSTTSTSTRPLYLFINLSSSQETLVNQLLSDGQTLALITNETPVRQRQQIYLRGGCLSVTSRILIVDLLCHHVPPSIISGLVVSDAHQCNDMSVEAFILRVFRQHNRTGCIKALSDNPFSFTNGFAKVEKIMQSLFVKKLLLWPRFHAAVSESLNVQPPDVVEIEQPLTSAMSEIHNAIVDVMNACLSELRSSRRGELDHVTLESSFFRSFDSNIKRDLGPQWHKVSAHTKQLISDVSILRSLNSYLLRYDCVTFYRYLLAVRAARKSTSLWLLTDAAETLFALAKKRVYTVSNIEVRHSASASISQSDSTLLNPLLKAASSTFRAPSQPAESKPTAKTKPNVSVTDSNSSVGVAANSTHLEAEIELVLEENPKWNLLIDILDEIRVERDKMLTEYHKCNEPILIDDDESSDDVVVVDDESSGKLHLVPGPTLLITKEERSGDQIRNYLERGGACLLSENWRNFLVSQRIHEHPLARQKTWSEADILHYTNSPWQREQLALLQELLMCRTEADIVPHSSINRKRDPRGHAAFKAPVESSTISKSAAPSTSAQATVSIEEHEHDTETSNTVEIRNLPFGSPGEVFDVLPAHEELIISTASAVNLEEIKPTFVIIFDPDIEFIRKLEVHQALHPDQPIRVYFLSYGDSTETQKYESALKREKDAFQRLIEEKARMVIPENQDGRIDVVSLTSDLFDDEADAASTRRGGARQRSSGDDQRPRVLVDVREFRSSLPSFIDLQRLRVVPMTLEVGDYILSPSIAVERKSLSDLIGSLQTGRLYNQMTSISRHFTRPMLLIEFDPSKPFALSAYSASENQSGNINSAALSSKLALLTLHFPQLRIIWARSPQATASMFAKLKQGLPEPELATGAGVSSAAMSAEAGDASAAFTPEDILSRLPGVTTSNIWALTRHVKCMADMCRLELSALEKLMGAPNAKKLHTFLHADANAFVVND